jgi:hypothetical protein
MTKDKIKQWAEALSGKSKDIDPLIHKKAQALRKILKEEDEALTKKYSTFNQASFQRTKNALESSGLLQKEKVSPIKSYLKTKKESLKLFITALIALMVGAMVPIQIATRGTDDSFFSRFNTFFSRFISMSQSEVEEINTEIVRKNTDPIKDSQDIIGLALSANLDLKSSNDNGKNITLIIYGLKKDELQHDSLRVFLDLSPQIEGNVRVIIKKK